MASKVLAPSANETNMRRYILFDWFWLMGRVTRREDLGNLGKTGEAWEE
jgi:hypothetical protein